MRVIQYGFLFIFTAMLGALLYIWHMELQNNRVLLQRLQEEMNQVAVQTGQPDGTQSAEDDSDDSPVGSWAKVNAHVKNTVVQIFSQITQFNWIEPYKAPQQAQATGSGFFIDHNGRFLTNAHVIDQAKSITIQIPSLGKRRFEAEIQGVNPERDLAVLQVTDADRKEIEKGLGGNIPYLDFAVSDEVQRGDEIMALGYPLGQQALKSTTGVVSGREHLDGRYMIQTSAPINPGNSGGPSLIRNGKVIGINTSKISNGNIENVGYIIPGSEVQLFLEQVKQAEVEEGDKAVLRRPFFLRRPFLGIVYNSSNDTLAEYLGNPKPGAPYITDVLDGSPASRAGVKPGDMLYEINGHKIDQYAEMHVPWSEDKVLVSDYVGRLMPDDTIHLTVYRNGKKHTMTTTFTKTELPPIRCRYPAYEEIPYEMIGGLVVMPLALNHMPFFASRIPELTQYMVLKNQLEPVLLITEILPDSLADKTRALEAGDRIGEVNGKKVGTIQEFRDAVRDGQKSGYITLKTRNTETFIALPYGKTLTDEDRLSRIYQYSVTPFVKDLQKQHNNNQGSSK